jgi:hypothetical protein
MGVTHTKFVAFGWHFWRIEMSRIKTVIESIARRCFNIDTLVTRKMDNLDFHEVSVWDVRTALQEAYQAGYRAGEHEGKKLNPR